jgi:hypothetical protein
MASRYAKRHYEDIAEIFRIRRNRLEATLTNPEYQGEIVQGKLQAQYAFLESLQVEFIDMFAADSPRFNRERFDKWTRKKYNV